MTRNAPSFDASHVFDTIRSVPDFRFRAALVATAAASILLPIATGYYGQVIVSSSGLRSTLLVLLAGAGASLASSAIPAVRSETRQFDLAVGLVAVIVAFKFFMLTLTMLAQSALDSFSIGWVTTAVASGLGIVRGCKAIRSRPVGV